jgi:hypothetical protein
MLSFKNNVLLNLILVAMFLSSISIQAIDKESSNDKLLKAIEKNHFISNIPEEANYLKNALHVKFKESVDLNAASNNSIFSFFANNGYNPVTNIDLPYKLKENTIKSSKNDYGIDRIAEVFFKNEIDPVQLSIDLMQHPEIEYATPIYIRETKEYTPNDPRFSNQWALTNMNIEEAWEITKGSEEVVIAIVDSGVDWEHEDLKDQIWRNPKEIAGNGIDDDENGKVDDTRGWDFVGNISIQDYQSGTWREDNNPKNLGSSHGTSSAGCASATTDNNIGIAGVGFNCKIMPIKCAADNPNLAGGILRGYNAILYAAQNGADVINCSWGGQGGSPAEQEIINQAVALGAVVVASSGNDGLFSDLVPSYPSNYNNVLNVGATRSNNSPAGWGNWGNTVHVYAGGEGVLTTTLNNSYRNQTGTSFSSPIVSGLVGLLKSIHPDWTPQQFIKHVRASSSPMPGVNDEIRPYYVGAADALRAVKYNNSAFPALTLPGIVAEKIDIKTPQNLIKNVENTDVEIELKNLLMDGKNFAVEISATDDFVVLEKNKIEFGDIAADETKTLELNISLNNKTPWYEGNIELILKYTADEYEDYEIIELPMRLETDNRFYNRQSINTQFQIIWYGISLPDKNNFWSIGYSSTVERSLLFKSINGNTDFNYLQTEVPAYALHAFNSSDVLFGFSPENGNSFVGLSSNGGNSFSQVDTREITPFINAFHFYDDENGIFLGDPLGSVWGIARTYDGGQTWIQIGGTPNPESGETGLVESVEFLDDNIWFGTTSGRIFYSTNQGGSWSVSDSKLGSMVSQISFIDSANGYALYSTGTQTNRTYYLASTTDGGQSWETNVFNFSSIDIDPVEIYTVPEAEKLCVLADDNRVLTSGIDDIVWENVLTKEIIGVTIGKAIIDGISVRLWSAGLNGVGFLDYLEKATVERRSITSTDGNIIDFENVLVGKTRLKSLEFQNDGNVPLDLQAFEILAGENTAENEFRVVSQPSEALDPYDVISVNVLFNPMTTGDKVATFFVKSDADEGDYAVQLTGFADEDTYVSEFQNEGIKVFPNPVEDNLNIELNGKMQSGRIIIHDIQGNKIVEKAINNTIMEINLNNIASGVYYLTIEDKNSRIQGSIIKK